VEACKGENKKSARSCVNQFEGGEEMRNFSRIFWIAAIAMVAVLFLIGGNSGRSSARSAAQDGPGTQATKEKPMTIQAQAMGQAQQLGRTFSVNLIVEEYSDADDQKGLMEAFNAKKNEGLVNALGKMHAKGRMAITGTLGYDVSYVRAWPQPDGSTHLRLVTNRQITFGEAWSDSRSMDYSLSGVDLYLFPDEKKNTGTLFPACQLKLDKEGKVQLELYQNAWKLVNVRIR
jgi:hypothetical protein